MKQILTTAIILLLLVGYNAQAQIFTIGPKVGISSTTVKLKDQSAEFSSGDAAYSYQIGAFARINLLGFYIQPEAYFNSVQGEYVSQGSLGDQTIKLNQNKIDIPVLFGFKLGPLRLNAGPVASFNLSSETDNDDFTNQYKDAIFAYQAGIGVDISNLTLDLRYEGNFTDQGSLGSTDNGKIRINQLMLSVGLKLL
jgi:opacity protein-like surface antigen